MVDNRLVRKNVPEDGSLNEKSRLGFVLGWVWMAFAAINVVDILRHEWDRSSAYAGSLLLLVSGIVFVLWLWPRLRADGERVLIRNPLREIDLPWGAIEEIDAHDTVRFSTEHKRYHSWVGHVPNRRRAAFSRARSRARSAGPGDETGEQTGKDAAASIANANDAEFLVRHLTDMADKHRQESKDAGHTEATVRWSWIPIAALGVPLLLFVVTLLAP